MLEGAEKKAGSLSETCLLLRWDYLTSIVVTLSAGSVTVTDEPLTGMVPTDTGTIGFCPWAEVAVMRYR